MLRANQGQYVPLKINWGYASIIKINLGQLRPFVNHFWPSSQSILHQCSQSYPFATFKIHMFLPKTKLSISKTILTSFPPKSKELFRVILPASSYFPDDHWPALDPPCYLKNRLSQLENHSGIPEPSEKY